MNLVFILLALYTSFFLALARKNFNAGLFLLILFLPAYLLRFNLGPVPSTILELNFFILLFVWLFYHAKNDWQNLLTTIKQHKFYTAACLLFFAGSLIAVITNPNILKALGLWRAYFLEPMILFGIIIARQIDFKFLRHTLACATIPVSLLALTQTVFGGPFPPGLWDDVLQGRATSFFTTPNAIGLFVVPIISLLLPSLVRLAKKIPERSDLLYAGIFFLGALAVIASYSQGAWAALGAAILIFAFLIGQKKFVATIITLGILTVALVPTLRAAFLFQDKAGQNRLTLWKYSVEYLTASPKHFVLGSGMRMFFNEVQRPHYNVKEMERLIYPHNIFLNFWLESGLLGLLAFVWMLGCLFLFGAKIFRQNNFIGAAIIASLIAFIVHGLVDVPYFKNDLAMMFWLLSGVILLAKQQLARK